MGELSSEQVIEAVFDRHAAAENAADLETTMATMTDHPHLVNVPSMIGGAGVDAVRAFYVDRVMGKLFPPDVEAQRLSRTVGDGRLVDELFLSFTHTQRIEWMLPGVEPTGRRVSVVLVVIIGIEDDKISYEHVYWDQASVLVQLGLLDPTGLPVAGREAAEKVLDPTIPDPDR